MTSPTTTVVVCAYTEQRWTELSAAITTAAAQGPDQLLLVIDHNDALLRRATAEFAAVEGLTIMANHRRRGLSGARNTAIAAAGGEVVVFLDDDATPEPDWLDRLRAPYADPRVIGVGGAAQPVWPAGHRRPTTLPSPGAGWGELDWVVGCSYVGLPTDQAPVRNLMGCNMSFRREVLADGFAEGLGRVGRTPLGCEETELCIRARQARTDAEIVFAPAARVRHHVSADRLTWTYLVRRGWAEGISKAAVAGLVGAGDATVTERGYVAGVLPRGVAREIRSGHLGSVVAIVAVLVATTLGFVRGRVAAPRLSSQTGGEPHRRLGSALPVPPETPLTPS